MGDGAVGGIEELPWESTAYWKANPGLPVSASAMPKPKSVAEVDGIRRKDESLRGGHASEPADCPELYAKWNRTKVRRYQRARILAGCAFAL